MKSFMKNKGKLSLALIVMLFCFVSCGKSADTTSSEGAMSTEIVSENTSEIVSEKITEVITTETVSSNDSTEQPTEQQTSEEEKMNRSAKLLYQGHASIRIQTPEGKTIYIDPFFGTGYDVPADLILLTHGHYDHTQTKLITKKTDDCRTISWKEANVSGEYQSFDLGYVKVDAVEAGYNKNHDKKECVGYILTFTNGATVYLSGDTSTTPEMSELADRHLDYAFICCDGVYNMDVSEASECARTIGAKHTIPYHMVPSDNPDGFDMSVAESFDAAGRIILRPGEELVLEKEAAEEPDEMTPTATLVVNVGDRTFSVSLENNSSADAFFEKLKTGNVKIEMNDYGNFEKVGDLPWSLPTNDTNITTNPGDLILYQGNKITIYYDENTWDFTKLGTLNASEEEIREAFGGVENITVDFYLEWTE